MTVDTGWFQRQYCQGRSIFSASVHEDGGRGGGYRRWNIEGRAIGKAKHTVGTTRSRETHARFLSRVQTTTCTPSIPHHVDLSDRTQQGRDTSRGIYSSFRWTIFHRRYRRESSTFSLELPIFVVNIIALLHRTED